MPGPRGLCGHFNPPSPGPHAWPQSIVCVVIPNPLPQIPRAQYGNFNPPCLAPEHCVVILDRLAQASMPGHKALCAHSKALTPDPQSTKLHFSPAMPGPRVLCGHFNPPSPGPRAWPESIVPLFSIPYPRSPDHKIAILTRHAWPQSNVWSF
jgi:hypothetical protein